MAGRDLPQALGEVFSVRDARAAGATERQLRRHELESPLRGTRSIRAAPLDDRFAEIARRLRVRCAAFASIAAGEFAFSHYTAAALYGVAIPWPWNTHQSIHVSVVGGQPRRSGVVTHRLGELRLRQVGGFPAVEPVLAWLQLAESLSLDDLVVAGDCLVRRKRPLCTLEDIHSAVARAAGARGVRTARLALADIRAGAASPPETELRLVVVRAGLPEPVIGYTVMVNGSWVGTPDLAFVREKVAMEYQGSGHRDEAVFEDDIERGERFREAGWTVIQVTKRHLRDPRAIVTRVRVALAAAGTRV